jgi:hypothetical protein
MIRTHSMHINPMGIKPESENKGLIHGAGPLNPGLRTLPGL